jgi:hypothetical protein
MVQLTAFGTRGGGRSINPYDAASNGNFDVKEPLLVTCKVVGGRKLVLLLKV